MPDAGFLCHLSGIELEARVNLMLAVAGELIEDEDQVRLPEGNASLVHDFDGPVLAIAKTM